VYQQSDNQDVSDLFEKII